MIKKLIEYRYTSILTLIIFVSITTTAIIFFGYNVIFLSFLVGPVVCGFGVWIGQKHMNEHGRSFSVESGVILNFILLAISMIFFLEVLVSGRLT